MLSFVSLFTVAHAYIVSQIIEGFHCTRSQEYNTRAIQDQFVIVGVG